MKVKFDEAEWYPVYSIRKNEYSWSADRELDLSAEEIADFKEVFERFKAWQKRIHQNESR